MRTRKAAGELWLCAGYAYAKLAGSRSKVVKEQSLIWTDKKAPGRKLDSLKASLQQWAVTVRKSRDEGSQSAIGQARPGAQACLEIQQAEARSM